MSGFRFKLVALLALAATALVGLAACGGDDDDDVAPAAGSGTTAAPTKTPDPRAGWPKTFRLGIFGGDDAETALKKQDALKDYLSKELGLPIELSTGTSYNAVIEAMRAGKVDAMMVGPFSYILAVQEANAEAVAVGVTSSAPAGTAVYDPNLKPFYISVVFAQKGNGIKTLNDLKGKGFNFVDPASTSGHLAPKTLLIKNGIDPDKDLKSVFAGSHPTAALSVYNGKAPAGATNESNLNRLDQSGQVKWCKYADGAIDKTRTAAEIQATFDKCPDGSLVVIAQTDPIPNTPMAVNKNLPESFKTALKDALLKVKDNPELVKQTGNWYVDPHKEMGLQTLDQFYNPLRDIAKLLNLNLKELQ